MGKLLERVEEIAAAMQRSYEADIDLLTRRDKGGSDQLVVVVNHV